MTAVSDSSPLRRLVVVGQGYVGLPLALLAVDAGWDVVGIEVDPTRVERLLHARSYVTDVADVELRRALDSGRYRPTASPADAAGFDVAVISVPTPLVDGRPDLSHVEDAGRALAPHVRPGSLVVLESTTYPGTTDELLVPVLEAGSGLRAGADFAVGYSPERLDPGNPERSLQRVPKVISGIDEASLGAVRDFYGGIVDRVVAVSGTREAELTKLLENTFRHVNVALVNELAVFAHDLGIDVWEAIDAASTKPFGFMRFEPGPGVGGHCLPIDPSYLAWDIQTRLGQPFRFVELANEVNERMPTYVARRVEVALRDRGVDAGAATVLLLGMAYKRSTGDVREAPVFGVAAALRDLGAAVQVCDPYVAVGEVPPGCARVELRPEIVAGADAVVLLTDHAEFDDVSVTAHARYVLDTRHVLKGDVVEQL
jgi:nucleotide sugar dehydrogenase